MELKIISKEARCQWRLGGDRCTNFFHTLVSQSVSRSNIDRLVIGNESVSDKERIKNHVREFNVDLYTEPVEGRPFPSGRVPNTITKEQFDTLEIAFSEKEVWDAVCELSSDKSPGPNGFPLRFYKSCWHFLEDDMMRVFENFYRSGYLDWHLNTTFISLIYQKNQGLHLFMNFGLYLCSQDAIKLLQGCSRTA